MVMGSGTDEAIRVWPASGNEPGNTAVRTNDVHLFRKGLKMPGREIGDRILDVIAHGEER